jgi:hypothetical protein
LVTLTKAGVVIGKLACSIGVKGGVEPPFASLRVPQDKPHSKGTATLTWGFGQDG